MTNQTKDLVSIYDAMELFQKSYSTLTRWMNDGKVQKHMVNGKIYLSQRELHLHMIGKAPILEEKTGNSIRYSNTDAIAKDAHPVSLSKANHRFGHYGEVVDALQKQLDREQRLNDRLNAKVDALQDKLLESTDKLAQAYDKVFQLDTILKSLPKMLTEQASVEKASEIPSEEAGIPSPPLPPEPEPYRARQEDENIFGETNHQTKRRKRSVSPFGVRDKVAGILGWQ